MFNIYIHVYLSPPLFLSAHTDLTAKSVSINQSEFWLNDLRLYPADKLCPPNGKWATDNVINAAQRMLRMSYPHIGGLQDTALAETLSFDIQRGEFVQVLNVSGCHWITVSTIGCRPGVVKIYDSIPSCCVPARTKEQIAAIIFTQDKELTLEFQAVQSQCGSSDCGLFALAFATSLCGGENPIQTNYIQHLLLSHLLDCFTQGVISAFPRSVRMKKLAPPRGQETLQLFCQCRLPEQGEMIQCDRCLEWFHSQCVMVPECIWKSADAKWCCNSCSF